MSNEVKPPLTVQEGYSVKLKENAPVCYICAPYAATKDRTTGANVTNAIVYSRYAIRSGYVPYSAHLAVCSYLCDEDSSERELGLIADTVMMKFCDECWVFGDKITEGMSREIEYFKKHSKPIRYFKGVPVTNYDKIKSATVDELTQMWCDNHSCYSCPMGDKCDINGDVGGGFKVWLTEKYSRREDKE